MNSTYRIVTTTGVHDTTGAASFLSGANLGTARELVKGLPRSVKDHMTNGCTFGPDDRLYIAQGSVTGYGAPDRSFGNRAESWDRPVRGFGLHRSVDGIAEYARQRWAEGYGARCS